MKKILLVGVLVCTSVFSFTQTEIGKYASGTFTIYLDNGEKQVILDSLMSLFNYQGCSLDSAVIDDPDPSKLDSSAYIVFYATCRDKKLAMGFYLTKQKESSEINYYIDDDENSVARVWKCDKGETCIHCGPVRNWFLGPVVGCDCEDCIFTTSGGSGFPWAAVITAIGVIIAALL